MHIASKKPDPNPPMLIYATDGSISPKTLTKALTLEEAQAALGGDLRQFQPNEHPHDLIYNYYCDEDGNYKNLAPNPRFSFGMTQIVGIVLAIPKQWFK